MKILVTCPPMLGLIDHFRPRFERDRWEVTTPRVAQSLSEKELITLVADHDGWIIGDDQASRRVFEVGKAGRLKAAVKWGIGTDNVDLKACRDLGVPIINTPGMFGSEVADLAIGYVIGLARQSYLVDRAVRAGQWVKPAGISLAGRTAAVVGLGDVGRNVAKRLLTADMTVIGYDPSVSVEALPAGIHQAVWPTGIEEADFLVLTCALTPSSHHMVNGSILARVKTGLRIVNVSRGSVIDESALIDALDKKKVHSAAMDVFEEEPLPADSPLRKHEQCIFGSHNASNTVDAVLRTSEVAIDKLSFMLAGA